MRWMTCAVLLLVACESSIPVGGQSGSEVTYDGTCFLTERIPADDGEIPDGWDLPISEVRQGLSLQQPSRWTSDWAEPDEVSVAVSASGPAFVLLLRDPAIGEPCADAIEFGGAVELSGAVDGTVDVVVVALSSQRAIVVETLAEGVVLPPLQLPVAGPVLLSGELQQSQVMLELAEQVDEGRRVLGEIGVD